MSQLQSYTHHHPSNVRTVENFSFILVLTVSCVTPSIIDEKMRKLEGCRDYIFVVLLLFVINQGGGPTYSYSVLLLLIES